MNVYGQPDLFDPTPVTAYDVHTYTWRRVAFGRGKFVAFLAESHLSDEEACDLFYNWLLKRAGITAESDRLQP